jgi:DNA-binding transcriptional ArsR family regulator
MKKGLSEICYKFFVNLEQSMVSHNLKPLLECEFVYTKREGKKRIYSANEETIGALFSAVENHASKFCPTGGKCQLKEG